MGFSISFDRWGLDGRFPAVHLSEVLAAQECTIVPFPSTVGSPEIPNSIPLLVPSQSIIPLSSLDHQCPKRAQRKSLQYLIPVYLTRATFEEKLH